MKKRAKNKLGLDKLKIARLNNLQNIIGGYNTGTIPPPTSSEKCLKKTSGDHSTKTKAMGSGI
ncbi:hypothetical protein [Aquimarina sp. 2201CG14-23]|uniref:hypothetical protein n=1 Tax=Aquimarina mycalae TaxID=3040073 RepID=UPI002477DF59|nr:hypothetical protein [Aquimarina sp. 2201CG14-23]MDH7448211.1 hypothetical protein [Aquimarina sp. 2201CG14-23]